MCFFLSRSCHFRQSGQRFGHTTHLTGYIHVPHLITVAWLGASFLHTIITLHIGAEVQAVPYPQSHVLGNEQRLGCCGLVINIGGNIDKTGELFVYGIIRCPYPLFVVVGAIHLNQHAMLSRNGIQVAIAILPVFLLIAVEVGPCTLHLFQFFLRGKVARFPVTAQLFVPNEGTFLAFTQAIDHLNDILTKNVLLIFVLTTGKGHSHSRHIMATAVSLQLGGRRVPPVRLWIAVSRQPVGITVVIQLLLHGKADELVNVEVAVPRQPVFAIDAHLIERQRLSRG